MSEPEQATSGSPSPGSPDGESALSLKGQRGRRKAPRWVIPFLRALERTGNARASAEDAGIDHTTAYARRRSHPDFASNWEWVLQAHEEKKKREEGEEVEAFRASLDGPSTIASPGNGPPPPGELGEELAISNGQVRRAGHDRWGKRKEQAFLAELAATGNLRQASAAVGISYEAVRKRRRKDPRLEAACRAAIEACRARIPEFLAGAAAATFDPDAIEDGAANPLPKVTVAEAIKIAQLNGGAKAASAQGAQEYEDDPGYDYQDDIADIRERLVQKLQRLRRRERPALLAQGWSYDEEYDREIPPGWVRAG